ncbi:MAG TPA: Na+ dependent nucleoside transporter N-terminal domain-containing protein, partial [Flavisolibacter sp.]|nr:Na+ dependent nucleoside transporter N-terminal domain-containing protein [Flavisolibacter sp.]
MNPVLLQNLGRGSLGMFFLIVVCYFLSTNRGAINWKLVIFGVIAQVMFAMGVLHTTAFGQPVFWVLFGLILVYTIGRKFLKLKSDDGKLSYNPASLTLSAIWQILFVIGLLLAPRLLGPWANLSILISSIAILVIAFKIGYKFPELLKWNILLSSAIVT